METKSSALPMVSVIMPARNEEKFIAKAIASIRHQNYPQELIEVIVVDNGSIDGTVAAAKASGARVIVKTNCRVGAVRNEGVSICGGQVLAFLDSDCEAGADWLNKAVSLLCSSSDIGAVGGVCFTPEDATWVERAWAPNRESRYREVDALACSSLIVARATFDRLGGFDELLAAAEDDDFSRKIRESKLRLISAPECAVIHYGYPKTLVDIAWRQVWHGANQLESSTGLADKMLILTHLFFLGEAAFLAGTLLGYKIIFGGLALVFGVVLVAALGRLYGYRENGVVMFLRLYAVLSFYFFGRSIGLLKNYFKLISKSMARSGWR